MASVPSYTSAGKPTPNISSILSITSTHLSGLSVSMLKSNLQRRNIYDPASSPTRLPLMGSSSSSIGHHKRTHQCNVFQESLCNARGKREAQHSARRRSFSSLPTYVSVGNHTFFSSPEKYASNVRMNLFLTFSTVSSSKRGQDQHCSSRFKVAIAGSKVVAFI